MTAGPSNGKGKATGDKAGLHAARRGLGAPALDDGDARRSGSGSPAGRRERSASRSDAGSFRGRRNRNAGSPSRSRGRDERPRDRDDSAWRKTDKHAHRRSYSRESYDSRASSYDPRYRNRSRSGSRSQSRSRSRGPRPARECSRSRSRSSSVAYQRRKASRSPSPADPDAPRKREEDDDRPSTSTSTRDVNATATQRTGADSRAPHLQTTSNPHPANQLNSCAPHSLGHNTAKGKHRARSPIRHGPVRNRVPLVRTRAVSPSNDNAFRFRFILPFAELVHILIGTAGWRAQEIKFFAGLTRLTFYHSEEFDGPLGELVGSREAIQDGLKGIAYALEEEMATMSDSQRERCGNVEQWTSFGEEFMEDLHISKGNFTARMRAEKKERMERKENSQAWQGPPGNQNPPGQQGVWQQGPPHQGPGGPIDRREFDRDANGNRPPQKENIWRGSAWGLTGPDNPPPNFDGPKPNPAPPAQHPQDLASRLGLGRPADSRLAPPDFSINIPKVAERHLIGHKGSVMQSIEHACRTRCFVERRGGPPCVQVWGDRAQIDLVMNRVDAIILQHCPTWRVGAERERRGPGWGPPVDDDGRISPSHRPSATTRPPPRAEAPLPYREPTPPPAPAVFEPPALDANDVYMGPGATSPVHSDRYDTSLFSASNASSEATSSADSAASVKSSVSGPRKRVKRETHGMTVDEFKSSRLMRGMTNCSGEVLLGALRKLTGMLEKSLDTTPESLALEVVARLGLTNGAVEQRPVPKLIEPAPATEAEPVAEIEYEPEYEPELEVVVGAPARLHVPGPVLASSRGSISRSPSPAPVASSSGMKRKQVEIDLDGSPSATRARIAPGPIMARSSFVDDDRPVYQTIEVRIPNVKRQPGW